MASPEKHDGSYQATRAVARSLGVEADVEFAGPIPKAAEACDWPAVSARWRSLLSSAAKRSSYPKKGYTHEVTDCHPGV